MKNYNILKKLAEYTTKQNVNSACTFLFYQEKLPESFNKFKKTK